MFDILISIFFSKDKKGKKSTIQPVGEKVKIGQRHMLSKIDCMKVNQAFGCFQEPEKETSTKKRKNKNDSNISWKNRKIQVLCGLLGY